jgi:tRNA U34 5-methylaminomethyl-2-thiouridine-forming methyltransferase MnmC
MPTATPLHTLVALGDGGRAVRSTAYGEVMHPVAGPVAEAQKVYVEQLRLDECLRQSGGEFVIWDVGLGAGANALAVLRAARNSACRLRLVSFDETLESLAFALAHADALEYLHGYESIVGQVLQERSAEFNDQAARWDVVVKDFPALLADAAAGELPKPHAILFDPFSPSKNAAMWTRSVFENLFRLLDPERPCALATYSRSTMVRVTMLLAGFFVGRGRSSGVKEETTVAANRLALLDEPLDAAWLTRARKSASAEPLQDARYRQAPLSPESWTRLSAHPQFRSA